MRDSDSSAFSITIFSIPNIPSREDVIPMFFGMMVGGFVGVGAFLLSSQSNNFEANPTSIAIGATSGLTTTCILTCAISRLEQRSRNRQPSNVVNNNNIVSIDLVINQGSSQLARQ